MSEIIVITIASFLTIPLPVLPLQIPFLNLVTDLFPALALGVGDGDIRVMERAVRSKSEPIIERRRWFEIFLYASIMALSVLGALFIATEALHLESESAVTISFLTLAFTQLWHVFNMRSPRSRLSNEVTKNPFVWGALALCTVLLLIAVYTPPLATVLKLVPPGGAGWLVAVGMSLIPLLAGVVRKFRRS